MKEQDLEVLLNQIGNRFLLTVAAAKRAAQLQRGASPLIEEQEMPPVITALNEMFQEKIKIEIKIPEPESRTPAHTHFISQIPEEDDGKAQRTKKLTKTLDAKKKEIVKKKRSSALS